MLLHFLLDTLMQTYTKEKRFSCNVYRCAFENTYLTKTGMEMPHQVTSSCE